eukprot:CAMPEP_0196762442 /NCGR_PEP_ID=MMETSP1095-20130614/1959_1 /TAXON_ID=96789 ORGANISM="Chromulina nebulosa, Strain UTEXLB2642" /NCGR_SAMPLE_ID=MMETSP1095 /ASSEMBLY_ACC=CAM_ASM_000446 /LENGTH=158 /DNA_ID=CAMNT_0042113341 /DNA_START=440 /DNA_END=916 /DNA_ORIENTATION=-
MEDFHNDFHSRVNGRRSNLDGLFSSPFDNDPFFSSFGTGGNFGKPLSQALRGGSINSSSVKMSSSYSGYGSAGRSTSTSTFIDSTGRKTIRTETTITYPDGRQETSIEERVEEPMGPCPQRIIGGNTRLNNPKIIQGGNITRTTSMSNNSNSGRVGYY